MFLARVSLSSRLARTFSSGPSGRQHADIVILGGGMVGSSLACALAGSPYLAGRKICLLEGAPNKPYTLPETFSNRVSAINPNSTKFLTDIGVWPIMEKLRITPFRRMYVWEDGSNANIEFREEKFVGHIVENDVTLHGLTLRMEELLKTNKDFNVIYSAKVKDCQMSGEKPSLMFENGEVLDTELLVGADGANSLVRKKLMPDVSVHTRDYEQMGVVGTVTFSEPFQGGHNDTAFQKFLPTGPIALLPLDPTRSSLVWTLPPKTAKELVKFDAKSFAKILNANLSNRKHATFIDSTVQQIKQFLPSEGAGGKPNIPDIISVDNVAAFPLGLGLPERYIADRVVLVGDACHRVHPLAGLGVNLGYGDAECLVRKLEENILQGDTLATHAYLCEYETERVRHNLPTALTIDAIQRLYSTNLDPVVLARSIGVQVINGIPGLKKMIMTSAAS